MKNRISYDYIMDTYGNTFYIDSELEEPDGKYISLYFNDENDFELYFDMYCKWHPKEREIEYDINVFNGQINSALLKLKQKRLNNKIEQIQKDF